MTSAALRAVDVPLTPDALREMIDRYRDDAVEHDSHRRRDHDSLERRVEAAERSQSDIRNEINNFREAIGRPVEVSNIRFTPAMVVAIVALCGSALGSAWLIDARDSARYDALAARMDSAKAIEESNNRLQDERSKNLNDAIRAMQAQQKLTDLNVGHLSDTIITIKGSRP